MTGFAPKSSDAGTRKIRAGAIRQRAVQRGQERRVYPRMGYIIALVLLLVFVPLLFLLLSRRTHAGGGIASRDHGLSPSRPSSDQPTPPAGPATDRPHQGSDHGVPPG